MDLTPDDIRFLQAIQNHGGRNIRISQIRLKTGFTRDKTLYRWDKMEDNGYIIPRYTGSEGDSERTATLTNSAHEALETVELNDEKEDMEDITKEDLLGRVNQLENQMEVLSAVVQRDVDGLREGLNRTADDVRYHDHVVEGLYAHHSDSDNREFRQIMDDKLG